MKKRIVALLLSVAMILSCLSGAYAANEKAVFEVDGPATAHPGDTITVDVNLTTNPGIAGFELQISYPEEFTVAEEATYGTVGDFNILGSNNASKHYYKVTGDNISNVTETGTLVTLTFQVADDIVVGTDYQVTCTVTECYDQNLKDLEYDSDYLNVSVTETPKEQFTGITFNDDTVTYNGNSKTIAVTGAPSDATVSYTYKDSSGNTVSSPKDVGTYTVTATISKDGYETMEKTATLTIEPKEVEVTGMTAADKTYDGTTTAQVSGGALTGVVEGDDVSATFPTSGTFASANAGTGIAVSVGTITLTGSSAGNYTVKAPSLSANINKVAITVTADNKSKIQGADDPALTYTYTGTLVGSDAFTGALTRASGESVGTYQITQGTLALTSNYSITFNEGTFTITDKTVTNLEITTQPTKTAYYEGDTFDSTGMVVTATYDNGKSEAVTGYTCSPTTIAADTKEITVSYGGKTATVPVTVTAKALSSITVNTTGASTSFTVGSTFSADGLVVTANYNNGTSQAVTNYTVSQPDMSTVGEKTVTVSYTEGDVTKTENYTITVSNKSLTDITINTANVTKSFVAGTTFNYDGLVVTASYDNGTSQAVTNYTVSQPDLSTAGEKTVTVSYTEGGVTKTANYTIMVTAKEVTSITVTGAQTEYTAGDSFQTEGLVVTAYYSDNTSEVVTGYTVTPSVLTEDTTEVTVTYADKSVVIPVTVASVVTYTITAAAGDNGTIEGATVVNAGGTATFQITPNEGYEVSDVLVNGQSVGAVTSYVFENVAADATITAVFQIILPFVDVAHDSWYYNAVSYVYEHGLMTGTSATTFDPEINLTRAMIAQVIYNLEGRPAVKLTTEFTDVSADAWYAAAVSWVFQNGIMVGFGDGTFGATEDVTREQMAATLYRYAAYKGYDTTATGDLSRFTDGDTASTWATTALIWASDKKILNGYTDGTLQPLGTAKRSEVAQMLMTFMKNCVE